GCTTTKEYEQICININSKQANNSDSITSIQNHHSANKQQSNIYFSYDKSALNKQDIQTIKSQSKILVSNPERKIFITGHADSRGSNKYNMILGEKRAKEIANLFINSGVKKSQIEIMSYGKTIPEIQNSTEEAYKYNRRAEIFIYNDNNINKNTQNMNSTKQYILTKNLSNTFYFDFNTSTLAEKDIAFIKKKATQIKKDSNNKIFIAGYTDPKGSKEYNLSLGYRRAKAVVDLLVQVGIAKSQIEVISYGKDNLKIDEDSDIANKYNRRVEMFIYQENSQNSTISNITSSEPLQKPKEILYINCRYSEISKTQPSIAYGILLLLGIVTSSFVL
ncbi:MAG: OmpA family protein, partial [Legionellales bacterium]|nr:OmpA family protein [Legionellales bacterium]